MLARMAGNVLLRTATDFVFDAVLPRAWSAVTAAVPRSAAKLPAKVQSAAAAAVARSAAKLQVQAQAQGGGAGTTMAELHARKAKMLGEQLKDYKIYKQRRELCEQAAEHRNKVHTARVVAVAATASVLAAAGIYNYKARRGHAAAPSV